MVALLSALKMRQPLARSIQRTSLLVTVILPASEAISTVGDLTMTDIELTNLTLTDDLILDTIANMNEFSTITLSGGGMRLPAAISKSTQPLTVPPRQAQ